MTADDLRALGEGLKQAWFAPRWADVEANLEGPGPHDLLIRSGDPRILNLPWELVELLPGLPLGCDAGWGPRRMPASGAAPGHVALTPGPLRILFLAAAPTDQRRLFYEREEEAILDATSRLPGRIVLHFSETGCSTELAELVDLCRPHIVHLSGHGRVDESGEGSFAFEDDRGVTDWRPAGELMSRIFRRNSVRCVFFNACESSQAAAGGLCHSLVSAGLPLAVGWSAKVDDDQATGFVKEFYRRIVCGEPVTSAAAHARALIWRSGQEGQDANPLQDATFAMPQVYGSAAPATLFDGTAPPTAYDGPRSEPFLLGDGIVGLSKGYIGRRREGQRLFTALRRGEVTFAVIQGIGGAGKSTLATRAANRLEGLGFRLVAVKAPSGSSPGEVAAALLSKLRGELGRAFQQEERHDLYGLLTSDKIKPEDQLRHAIEGMNSLRLGLVIDGFEKR